MTELGKRIQRARRGSGQTQVQLADRLGVESITISRWERGVTQPTLRTLERISALTKTPLSDLIMDGGASNVILDELKRIREELDEIKRLLAPLQERRRI